ncbi:hypothetical protein ACEPAF_7546 [Sanghuangporus sanghuang]
MPPVDKSPSRSSLEGSPILDDKEKYGGIELHVEDVKEEAPDAFYISKYRALGPLLKRLFSLGVEARGVERIPEDQRDSKNSWDSLFLWLSANTVLTTIPVGTLAQASYNLTFPHAVAVILCFGALGAAATAFVATLGPKTGMRTMIITRYSSGYVGCIINSLLNILMTLGFSTTCVILGGQTLASINPGSLPLTVGVIIVSVISLIPCFVGYDYVHTYERYAWIIIAIIMVMLFGLGGEAGFDISAQKTHEDKGTNFVADILSFGGIIFGSFGWGPVAADYNCRLPPTTSSTKVFFLTFFGLFIPITFIEILGAALMTITDPAYTGAFSSGGTGGLLSQVLAPWKEGGKFILTLLALSVIANNIPNIYSGALCIQALGRPFARVPRFFWTFLIFAIITIAGVAGREHFSEILSNFLSLLSYWLGFFVPIIAAEHYVFRRKDGPLGGYDLEAYDDWARLPLGIAGIAATCFGIAGAALGMAQTWYVSPIAAKFGPSGGDLGFELAAAFAALSYLPLRWLEIRLIGR